MNSVIFPGQGAQYSGMGKSLYENFSQAREIFSRADAVLGYGLSGKCFNGSEEELKDTALQQVAILTVSLAAYEVFRSKNIVPSFFSGLSLGEYSCLYAAGVLDVEDLVLLVRERAMAMQRACQIDPAAMLAVMGMKHDDLRKKSQEEGFYLSNINSQDQIVVSLKKEDKDRVKTCLESCGAKVVELAVSGGFHSPFMETARQHLELIIYKLDFHDAKIPIVSNVTAKGHTKKDELMSNLVRQLVSPVLWNDCVNYMAQNGVSLFYETGPSKVLRGLIRKINPSLKVVNIEKKEDLDGLSGSLQ